MYTAQHVSGHTSRLSLVVEPNICALVSLPNSSMGGWRHILCRVCAVPCHHTCCVLAAEDFLWSPVVLAPVAPWSCLPHSCGLNPYFSSIKLKGAASHRFCAGRCIINQGTVVPIRWGEPWQGLNLAARRASMRRVLKAERYPWLIWFIPVIRTPSVWSFQLTESHFWDAYLSFFLCSGLMKYCEITTSAHSLSVQCALIIPA